MTKKFIKAFGKICKFGSKSLMFSNEGVSPIPPEIELPANTLRFRFENTDYDPTSIDNGGTWTKVADSSYNDWDWTCNDTNWESKFNETFTEDNTSIIAAGDTSRVNDMNNMFMGCTSLTSVPLFNTSNVTKMTRMFYGCTSLTSVPQFDTSNVTNMVFMFYKCTSLTSVPLFDTSNVGNMNQMFSGCTSLTSVPLFDTSNVGNMGEMFRDCTSLTSVPLFDTSKVWNMALMFYGCTSLTSVPLFNTSNVTGMNSMFSGCTSLTFVPLFDTSSVTGMGYMFYGCINIQSGMLALYLQASSQVEVPSYSNCFTNAGTNTESGMVERAQIPTSWGGLSAG